MRVLQAQSRRALCHLKKGIKVKKRGNIRELTIL